jgi:peptide chain release factor 1
MLDKLQNLNNKYDTLTKKLSEIDITNNLKEYQKLSKELSDLEPIIKASQEYKKILAELEESKNIIKFEKDKELIELAETELEELKIALEKSELDIKKMLIPKDPLDEKNIIMEIRAGTGGDESTIFSADLFRMYSRFAELNNWKLEILSSNSTGVGGFKEIIMMISGKQVYSKLKYESGVHRVQRVPETEANGRVHTSAVTVAVLPEAEDVEIEVRPEDIRIDVFRSSGNGGQSVNTTDSAVRITHLPTNIVVSCQDEKSQLKNRAKALKVLKSRLLDIEIKKRDSEISSNRKKMVGSGDRSKRIRTYNFPQNRLTDHRIGLTLYKLDLIMEGNIEEVIDALSTADELSKLSEFE